MLVPLAPHRSGKRAMSNESPPPPQLRDDAEAQLARTPPCEAPTRSAAELLHELQVRQIELETQNEALRQSLVTLEESRDRYVDLYEFAPVGYLTLSREARIAAINLTGATLLGDDRQTLLHQRFTRFVVAEDQDQWRRHFLHAVQPGGKQTCELRLRRCDGTLFAARLDCLCTRSGGAPALRIAVTDISAYKQAQQSLLESQERFHSFMTHSPIASWIVDAEGRYQYVNPTYYKIFGVPATDMIGKRISEVYPPGLAAKYLHNNQAAIDAWQPIERVQPGMRADGSEGEFLVIEFPIRDASGQPMLCGNALDITERRQAVTRLHAANQRLESLAADQAAHLRELAFGLTFAEQRERDRLYELLHDEVQPLLVAARLSLSGLSARTPPEDLLRVATEASEHITQVIQVARTLSRQLNPPLIRERGLNPALEALCHWVKDNHGQEVALTCAPEGEPEDLAIRLLCFNAVRELLLNVTKHAGCAQVTLTLRVVDRDILRITVADRGSGFDPNTITRGSGLAGIERRLGMFGGSLQIDSRPGEGTVTTLSVPIRPVTAAKSAPGRDTPRREKGKRDAQDTDCG